MTTIRRIVAFIALTLLPLGSLFCQQTSAKPQNPAPQGSGSQLNLNFGPAVSNAEGKAAANRFLQAMGGPAKVNSVKTLQQTVAAVRQGQHLEVEQSIVYPDMQAQKMKTPQGLALMVVTPRDAFSIVDGRLHNVSPTQRAAFDQTLKHDFINILQRINNPKYVFVATGREKVGGTEATVVDVEADGVPTRWWIAADGKLLQERYSDVSQAGGTIQVMTYADWKSFGGLNYPTRYELFSEAGQPRLSMTLTAMEVNSAVDRKLFERPTQ
jgi:outer membrane lipoprotein-sorting protein